MALLSALSVFACLRLVFAAITVYSQIPLQATQAADLPVQTNAAYDNTVLNPPPLPNPLPPTAFTLNLQPTNATVQGISIPQSGAFWGFSIEMSVLPQTLGKNSSFIQVPFLNLMANLHQRAGDVHVRVGGNTQDFAAMVPSLPNGTMIGKQNIDNSNPTQTPSVLYTIDMFYMFSNISALTGTKWFLGIPFNDTSNFRLEIAVFSQSILGDNLLGLQVANEPDLYAAHNHRDPSYGPQDYFNEFGQLVQALSADSAATGEVGNLIAPSISGTWTPEQVWDTGFLQAYQTNLKYIAFEHYPENNCFALFGVGSPVDYQTTFADYLNHDAGRNLIQPYLNSANLAQQAGKPLYMFETNSASCGGFPGISNSFGAGLWALDYGLQMAFSNFSGGLLHVGGQNVFYNPFTPPQTNVSTFHQWTIGAVYYSALIMAEVIGKTGTAQLTDLGGNGGNIFTPQYAIYENGAVSKVALFNYMTDPSGANDYVATIQVGGGDTGASSTTPSSVQVKYFASDSVSTKDNITWAGQTLGTQYNVDGRLQGNLNIVTINCDPNNGCAIPVKAPGFALVFLNPTTSETAPATETFSTTALTKTMNTATVAPGVLQTSNGHSGNTFDGKKLGSTSPQKSINSERRSITGVWSTVLVGLMVGVAAALWTAC